MSKSKYYKRPNGLYEAIRVINGKRIAFRGRTQREVEQKMIAYKDGESKGPLFEKATEDWWGEFMETAAPNSLKGYKPAMERAIERFKGKRLFAITAQEIKLWVSALVKRGFAKKTIQTHLIVLNGIYKRAQEEYNSDCNPAALVRLPKNLPQQRRQLPSDEDDARMLAHVTTHPLGLFAFLAKYTGARRGELLGLRYGDFDYNEGVIHIERSVYHVGNRPEIKAPKTDAGVRSVPLLEIIARVMPKGKKKAYVFSDDGGKTPLTSSRIEDLWANYCKETGVTATPHQWRHLYATVLFDAGIDAKDAQVLMGHAQFSTTMDIYTHVKDQRITKTANKLNNFIQNTRCV